MDDGLKIID